MVFGSTSGNSSNTLDTSIFVQKPYLRSKYFENNNEEDIDMENQTNLQKLLSQLSAQETPSNVYADKILTIQV